MEHASVTVLEHTPLGFDMPRIIAPTPSALLEEEQPNQHLPDKPLVETAAVSTRRANIGQC